MLKLGYAVAARIDLNINKTTITLNTSFVIYIYIYTYIYVLQKEIVNDICELHFSKDVEFD